MAIDGINPFLNQNYGNYGIPNNAIRGYQGPAGGIDPNKKPQVAELGQKIPGYQGFNGTVDGIEKLEQFEKEEGISATDYLALYNELFDEDERAMLNDFQKDDGELHPNIGGICVA